MVFEEGGDISMTKINKMNGQRGFTLIELMIVVAIIGILAAVAIPKFAEMLRKSKEGASKGSLTGMRSALTIYIGDNEGTVPLAYTGGADSDTQSEAETQIRLAMVPRYLDNFPTGKLGTYHADNGKLDAIEVYDGNRSSNTITTDLFTTNGWNYTSNGGSSIWVNCTHTDTKSTNITQW